MRRSEHRISVNGQEKVSVPVSSLVAAPHLLPCARQMPLSCPRSLPRPDAHLPLQGQEERLSTKTYYCAVTVPSDILLRRHHPI